MIYKNIHIYNNVKIFEKLLQLSILYKLYNVISTLIIYIKEYKLVSKIIYSEEFLSVLKKYLNKEFKIDWIGRIYAIINPNIDINGKFNFNNTIIEIDDEQTNNEAYVKNWLFKQMQLIADLFKISNIYNYISFSLTHVGPINADNFLVIFDMTARIDFTTALKKFLLQSLIYAIIIIAILTLI